MDPLGNWPVGCLILSLYLLHPIVLPGYAQLFQSKMLKKVRMPLFAFPVANHTRTIESLRLWNQGYAKSFCHFRKAEEC